MKKRYRDFNSYLKDLFGERVQKITVDAGLTCPNRDGRISYGGCIYCNARGSGTGAYERGLGIGEQIAASRDFIAKRYKARKFLIYFQSFSNTYAPVSTLERLYNEALSAIDGVVGLSVGTRPDCVNPDVLTLLAEYAKNYLIWIEYGLQSAHDPTLTLINRGHDFQCFEKAVADTKNRGINICVHVILGLPGETREHMMATARAVADMGLDGIKIHLLYVIKGTYLDKMHQEGRYRCLEQAEYVDLVCEFLEYLPPDMVIQRLTGDPHPEELSAPAWALDKRKNLNLIMETLERQDRRQGKRFAAIHLR